MSFHPETENYKYWTIQEETKLKELVETGNYSFKKIGKLLNRSSNSCQRHSSLMCLSNKYIARKYSCNDDFWASPNLINCYWAGMSAADASVNFRGKNNNCFTYRISLSQEDREHLERFSKDIAFDGPISNEKRYKKRNIKEKEEYKYFYTSNLKIHNNQWGIDLERIFNIVPNKTLRLGSPKLDNDLLKLAYFIGYTDGDGCICLVDRKGKRELIFRFASASYNIINWLKELIDNLFPKEKYARKNKKTNINQGENHYSFAISGMRALVLYDYLLKFPVPKMKRKWNRPEILQFLNDNKQKYPHFFNLPTPDFGPLL